jgi:TonB family protein
MLASPGKVTPLRRSVLALIAMSGLHPNAGCAGASSEPAALEKSVPSQELVVRTTTFRPVQVKHLSTPEYPPVEVKNWREGWAIVSTMVDRTGKPYETAIMRSSGNAALDRAAVTAMEHSTLEPAISDGQPIESAYEIKYSFVLQDARVGASPAFVRAYEKFVRAMQGESEADAEAALKQLDAVNLYEDAYLGLAQYKYALRYGTQYDQIEGLKRAIADETGAKYLPKPEFEGALRSLLVLDVRTNHFREALTLWEQLQKLSTDSQILGKLKPVMDQVNSIQTDPRPYAIVGELTPSASSTETMQAAWFLDLFKTRFRIQVEEGSLSEIKLRCDKTFLSFPFDPELEYHVESRFGKCEMQLLGAPGSRITVTQSG